MKPSWMTLIGALASSMGLLACEGSITGPAGMPSDVPGIGSGSAGQTPDTPIATADAVALLTNPPAEPTAADIACTNQAVVPRGRIWRLSANGYKNSIRDNLGYAGVDTNGAP